MKYAGKLSLIIVAALLTGVFAGCNMVRVNPEKDRNLVLAEFEGEKILKGEMLDRYEQEKVYYNITEEIENDPKQKEYVLNVKKQILEGLIIERLFAKKAEEAGFVVTDELRTEASAEFNDMIKQIEEGLKAQDEAAQEAEEKDDQNNDQDYARQAREYVDSQLEKMGVTEQEYIEMIAEQKAIDKYRHEMVKDIKATDEDVHKYYDEELSKQKNDPSYAEYAVVELYKPERARVKHILIELPEDQQQEYAALVREEKEQEAKDYLDEKLKAIKPKAEEVANKARTEENFEMLIEQENPDEAAAMEDGLIIHSETYYMPKEYLSAALKLEEGEISDPVESSYGYFIIKAYEKFEETTIAFEEKSDQLKEAVDEIKKNEKWNSLVEEWKKQVKKYENRI